MPGDYFGDEFESGDFSGEPPPRRSFDETTALVRWSSRWTLPQLFALQPPAFGRVLLEAADFGVTGVMSQSDGIGALLVRETWARYGEQLAEVVHSHADWRPVEFAAIAALVDGRDPALHTRRFDDRVATHRQFVIDDLVAEVGTILDVVYGRGARETLLHEGFLTTDDELADRRERYVDDYDSLPRHPLAAMYVTPSAMVDAVLGGQQGRTAGYALRRLAAVMGCGEHQRRRWLASLPAAEQWSSLPSGEARTLLIDTLQRIFLGVTHRVAATVPHTTDPTVSRLPLVPADVLRKPATVAFDQAGPLSALNRPPVVPPGARGAYAPASLRQWALGGSLGSN